jgi:hypothetical protein
VPRCPLLVRSRGQSGPYADISRLRFMTDAVEKGKNELILFFTCAPVEIGISQSNVSQRAYESCRLEIGLLVCPPTSFSNWRTSALKKFVRPPKKTFSTASVKKRSRPKSAARRLSTQKADLSWTSRQVSVGPKPEVASTTRLAARASYPFFFRELSSVNQHASDKPPRLAQHCLMSTDKYEVLT